MPLTGDAKKAYNREWHRRHRGPTQKERFARMEARVVLLEDATARLLGRLTGMVWRDEVPAQVEAAMDEFFDCVIPKDEA